MAVYLIRHTEFVVFDDQKRFSGQADPPLSSSGIEHAHRLADRLRQVHFDSVHSSDLQRCLQTAEVIARASGVPVRPDIRLREIDTGLWEGLTFEGAKTQYPFEYSERERDLVGYRFPGGESFRDLHERVFPAFAQIVDEGGESILVVGHRGVNRVLLCDFLGLPLESLFSIEQDYGCVNLVRASRLPNGARRFEVTAQPTLES